jgi:hypothetical protein
MVCSTQSSAPGLSVASNHHYVSDGIAYLVHVLSVVLSTGFLVSTLNLIALHASAFAFGYHMTWGE